MTFIRRYLRLLLLIAVFSLPFKSIASDFQLVIENPQLNSFKTEINNLIPNKMKEVIAGNVVIKVKNLNKKEKNVKQLDQICTSQLILGKAYQDISKNVGVVEVDQNLINLLQSPDTRLTHCPHKNPNDYVKAAILHEISHLYDKKIKISKEETFLNLSGWIAKGLIFKKRTHLNSAYDRSPDRYEFKNPAESFSVNFEHFLLDESFKCRRPTYYDFYKKHFDHIPFPVANCEMNNKITLITQSLEKTPVLTKPIDPSRVYQVHYLFAGKGKEMMSRWGHAMFRLVICAPNKKLGPECLQDVAHHIIVSYRANIEDMTMDYKKGLDGSYASQLFLMNLSDVVNEYTKGEFRDVISLPLKMKRSQIELFSLKVLENYWSYKGSYYFLTNNCATEALNLLRSGFPDNKAMQKVNITTPLGLYDYLVKSKLAEVEVLNDLKYASKMGYYFPGVSEKLKSSLNYFLAENEMNFEQFALVLSAAERLAIYQKKLEKLEKKIPALAHALRLEDQILLSREQQFAKKVGEALFGKNVTQELKDSKLDKIILSMREDYKKLAAENFVKSGYGIPLKSEFIDIADEVALEIFQNMKNQSTELQEAFYKYFPQEIQEMKETLENRYYILKKLSEI